MILPRYDGNAVTVLGQKRTLPKRRISFLPWTLPSVSTVETGREQRRYWSLVPVLSHEYMVISASSRGGGSRPVFFKRIIGKRGIGVEENAASILLRDNRMVFLDDCVQKNSPVCLNNNCEKVWNATHLDNAWYTSRHKSARKFNYWNWKLGITKEIGRRKDIVGKIIRCSRISMAI